MQSPLLGADTLPREIEVAGRVFDIASDFRTGIRFETLMFDTNVPLGAKVSLALGIWFGDTVPDVDIGMLIAEMLTFYRCGLPESDAEGGKEQLYSYTFDYMPLYAGFLAAYGVDLFSVEYLHWWRFRAMLSALPAESEFMRIVGYRGQRITADMSKEQKAHLRKMKRLYALPNIGSPILHRIRTEAQHDAAIAAIEAARERGEI